MRRRPPNPSAKSATAVAAAHTPELGCEMKSGRAGSGQQTKVAARTCGGVVIEAERATEAACMRLTDRFAAARYRRSQQSGDGGHARQENPLNANGRFAGRVVDALRESSAAGALLSTRKIVARLARSASRADHRRMTSTL